MFDHRASVRYAKPLIDLSIAKGIVDDVQKDVNLFLDTCKSNFDFSLMLKNPIIPINKKVDILREIFSKNFNDSGLGVGSVWIIGILYIISSRLFHVYF